MEKNTAILMADLTGYTAMTDLHGGGRAQELVIQFLKAVKGSLVGESKLFQMVGDQAIIISSNANDLLHSAAQLIATTRKMHLFLELHIGLHYGPLLEIGGHIYGRAVNEAARLVGHAKPSQIIASRELIDQLHIEHPFLFNNLGELQFKNVLRPIEVYQVILRGDGLRKCPVCQMQLQYGEEVVSIQYEGTLIEFCSLECLDAYNGNPALFSAAYKGSADTETQEFQRNREPIIASI